MGTSLQERELKFHDLWASEENSESVHVKAAFTAFTAPENRFILERMGSLKGKKILDVGCGLGESSVFFAMQGAQVTAVDISPNMVELTCSMAKKYGTEVEGVVSTAESLNIAPNTYDFVYLGNILHHIPNKTSVFNQVHAALKPGGFFYSWDPLCYNPVINVYRQMATEVRTEDEAPLSFDDYRLVKQLFKKSGHREFWILTLSLFLKYYLFNRIHPNDERYWKRILKESKLALWWWFPFYAIDLVLTRIPLVRRLSWNMVMWGQKG